MLKIFLLLGGLFSLKTVIDSGEFKKINPHFDGNCSEIYGLEGPEDIIIVNDSIAIVSADPRRKILSETKTFYSYEQKSSNSNQGSIFLYNLISNDLINITENINFEFHPHGISSYKNVKGDLFISAINHTSKGHFVEVFIFENNQLKHINKITDALLISPNDIVMLNENQFYITNDHGSKKFTGKMIEDYLQLSRSSLIFYNGNNFEMVIDDLQYANGVNISNDGEQIYVSETIGKTVLIYNRDKISNKLHLLKSIDVDSGVDNIEVDNKGNLWIGSHPKLFDFVKHAKDPSNLSSSQVIKISMDDYSVNEIYLNDGKELSGSSVAAFHQSNLLIGAVFENKFLHCFLNE